MPKIFIDATVVRSCAGRITPQLENLMFLDHVLQISDVMIMHHTDCSAEIWKNDDVRRDLNQRAPEHNEKIEQLKLPGFDDLLQSVREDVQIVRDSPFIRKELADRTRGFVYDIKSGVVTPVE
ncbi:hypothetical protein BKA67DRAFT_413150 [Truncatella angustata]|uniref:Carbonic anhydrase n=1 Tax=Truncatella angustata TaxID=152316 RepID=A0A9P8RLX6_9PEZI|nr:uncharacterized protein BKA67DRAFT_413150 [Truncatella angustata]KAH6646678.1 hypothetical protein BKA67DRAFT_413150 [Truncatella angustata]